jgi:aryl-alcohol dehydrogenase-like predicted oxidoreductase
VECLQLGRSALRVSTVALETRAFGGKASSDSWLDAMAGAGRLIDRSVDAGVNLADTADAYST